MGSVRFWIGMVIGCAVGAAVAASYTPAPGEEIRARWLQRIENFKARYRERKRVALLHAKGRLTEKVGEMMEEAGRLEQDVAEQAGG